MNGPLQAHLVDPGTRACSVESLARSHLNHHVNVFNDMSMLS